ncbi:MAG: helix-turn-helix transcriptional regulator [Clostridiales bacterium]|nr:helix-turn-helix transcriptional regulator [Clostridiales bacterium]
MHYSEITVIFSGQMQYVINGKKFVLNSNDVIYIPYGSIRDRISKTEVDYVSFNFIDEINEDSSAILYLNAVNSVIKNLITTCDAVRELTSYRDDERLLLLLQCLIKQLNFQNGDIKTNPLVLKIKKYIRANLNKKISLTDISEHTFFSPVHCEKLFRKETNTSIIDYVINKKINEAQYLLMTEPTDIRKIAEKIGFDNYNYFSRLFKKRTGFTPSQYKKRHIHTV